LFSWKNTLSWISFVLFVIVLIIFANNIYNNQRCKKVVIDFDKKAEGYFITKETINNLITDNGNKPIIGTKFNQLNFSSLEKKILKNRIVKYCQISRTLGGNLQIKVAQKNPIARIVAMAGLDDRFKGYYLDDNGGLFPLSDSYTKRVVLLSGKYLVGKNNLRAAKDKNLLAFIIKVNDDEFWNANIAHIIIEEDQNINFLPLIGDYTFEYGIPKEEDFENKMRKIKVFYKQIDHENMSRYKTVSVRYSNQIVCQLIDYKPVEEVIK
jgi:cell division protein FtsQ